MCKTQYSVTIKELPADERPRERLQKYGPSSLSTSELIAIILGGGFQNFSALSLAQYLLQEHGNLSGLSKAGLEELCKSKGVGNAKASQLLAAFEIGRRVASTNEEDKLTINSPEDAATILTSHYGFKDKEHVGILALDSKNKVIKEVLVSIGILDGSMVHPREVFRPAIISNAAGVILFHNHPSGDPEPSQKDIEITSRIAKAGKLMGMELLDHIIVAHNNYLSMRRQGLMS